MKLIDYLKFSLENKYLHNIEWHYSMFSILEDETQYAKNDNGKLFVKVNDKLEIIEDCKYETILFQEHKFTLPKDIINNSKEVKTTIGEFIVNYLLLYIPFGKFIDYQTNEKDFLDFEGIYNKIIIPNVSTGKLTVQQLKAFGVNATFLRATANLFVISSSERAITPPKGIIEYKKKRIKYYKDTFGEDVFKDKTKIADLEADIIKYIDDYLKDDPTYKISTTKKIISNSLKKRFGVFGYEDGITESDEGILVENSLMEGFPKDKKQLAVAYNTARTASYFRGNETRISGVISDTLTRAFTGLVVEKDTDCKVSYGLMIDVTNKNYVYFVNRFYIKSGKTILIETLEDAKSLVGKTIELRSFVFCKHKKHNHYCEKCAGKELSRNKNRIYLAGLGIGKGAMTAKLKRMHVAGLSTVEIGLDDLIP